MNVLSPVAPAAQSAERGIRLPSSPPPAWQTAAALLAIMALGSALRLFRIGDASLWSDELFSVLWVRNTFGFLWGPGLEIETTPALYYAMLKPWLAAFGDGDVAVRSLSAALSVLTIPLVYLLARRFGGRTPGLLAAGLFAAMPMQVHYAQEARAYALLPLLYALAALALAWLVERSRGWGRAAPAPRLAHQAAPLGWYGSAALMLVYAHATSAFTLAALGLAGMAALWRVGGGWTSILRFAAVNAVVVVLAIPEIMAMFAQAGRFDMDWVQPPDAISLLNAASVLLVDPSTPLTLFRLSCLLAAAVIVSLGILVGRARLGWLASVMLIGVPLGFLVSTILVSFASPFFIPRIVVWLGVPFCILAALALVSPRQRGAKIGFVVALLLAWGVGLQGVYGRSILSKEDWRGLAAELRQRLGPDDLVAIGPGTNLRGLAHYGQPGLQQHRWLPARTTFRPPLFLPAGVAAPQPLSTAALAERIRHGKQVWLILKQQDWEIYGAEARSAVPEQPPQVIGGHAMLSVLHWTGAAPD